MNEKEINECYRSADNNISKAYYHIEEAIEYIINANKLNWIGIDELDPKKDCDMIPLLELISDQLMNFMRALGYLQRD